MPSPESSVLAARHARIRQAITAAGVDALVVTAFPNIRYLSNHAGSAGVLVLTGDAVHLIVDFRYEAAIAALQASRAACPGLRTWPVPASYDEALVDLLSGLGVRRIGFEAAHLTVARYEWLTSTITARALDLTLHATSRIVESARIVKDDAELQLLRDAARRLRPVIDAALGAVRPGTEERAVAAAIEGAMRAGGYERPAFDTIVASGPNAALPHYRAGERALTAGDLVVLDFGGVLEGYCSDITLTVTVGEPTAEARRVYDAVREAQLAAIAAVRPGVTASSIDAAARDILEGHGLGAAFGHGTGHGLGLDVHEEPRIGRPRSDSPDMAVVPGMVFTIEPGAYIPGWGGVRIEDDVLVTGSGCEVLTSAPRELLAL